MLTKIVTLFLVFIAVLGMFGKLYWLLPTRAKKTTKCTHSIPGACIVCWLTAPFDS